LQKKLGEEKKFALLSQNYQRFGLDEPKAAPAMLRRGRYISHALHCNTRPFALAALKKRPANLAGLNIANKS